MINYDAFLSRAAERMKESAIRKMGTVLAQARDIGAPDDDPGRLIAAHRIQRENDFAAHAEGALSRFARGRR